MTVKQLSERTLIPIGLAVVIIGGGAMWVSSVNAEISGLKTSQTVTATSYNSLQKDITEILIRVTKIDETLRHLEKKVD
jgi:hypothetical protein